MDLGEAHIEQEAVTGRGPHLHGSSRGQDFEQRGRVGQHRTPQARRDLHAQPLQLARGGVVLDPHEHRPARAEHRPLGRERAPQRQVRPSFDARQPGQLVDPYARGQLRRGRRERGTGEEREQDEGGPRHGGGV